MAMDRLMSSLFKNPRKVLIQMLAAMSASFSFMIMGTVRGWSSPGMPALIASGAVNMTAEDVSWISSLPPLASLFGSLSAGVLLQTLGRRLTLMLISIPYSLGFLLIGFASDKSMLYIGRIVDGLMIGVSAPAAQIYIGECASPRIRGALGSFTAILLAFGILAAYVIGAFVDWDELAWILSTFPIFLFGFMYFMPETPSHLLTKGREEEARKSLQFLRGSHTDVGPEFERLKANVMKGANSQQIKPKDLLKGSVLKPLGLSMALMFFQQFSGINAVIYFTVSIFESAGSSIDKNLATIIVGIVQLIATIGSMVLVDKAGRRILLLASGSFMALALAAMGAFFYMKEVEGDSVKETLGWLPLASLIVFIIAYSGGYANVPFLIMGELFPSKYRGIMGSLSSSFNLACTFTIVRTFGDLQKAIQPYGAFWFYMSCCIVGVVFVFFFLPETKGKQLDEIERMFASKEKRQEWAKQQQLTSQGTQSTLCTVDVEKNGNTIFTVDPIPRPKSFTNAAYESESEDSDNDEVVATPL